MIITIKKTARRIKKARRMRYFDEKSYGLFFEAKTVRDSNLDSDKRADRRSHHLTDEESRY
jgi:hypothetical protein